MILKYFFKNILHFSFDSILSTFIDLYWNRTFPLYVSNYDWTTNKHSSVIPLSVYSLLLFVNKFMNEIKKFSYDEGSEKKKKRKIDKTAYSVWVNASIYISSLFLLISFTFIRLLLCALKLWIFLRVSVHCHS